MKKPAKVFSISLPNPCNENWDAMKAEGEGRYCSNCKKVVVDFSSLTNKELYEHFSRLKEIPCGRFNNMQLDVNLVPEKPKSSLWKSFYKPIAAVIALLTLKNAHASIIKKTEITVQPVSKKSIQQFAPGKVTISGTVKTGDGLPIQDAELFFDDKVVAKTDKNGNFQFEYDITSMSRSYVLQASAKGMVAVTRSYSPGMQSTSYDFVLYEPSHKIFYGGGFPVINDQYSFIHINIHDVLTDDAKTELDSVAKRMNAEPALNIKLYGYASDPKEVAAVKKRQETIINYLLKNNISAKRISTVLEEATLGTKDRITIEPVYTNGSHR